MIVTSTNRFYTGKLGLASCPLTLSLQLYPRGTSGRTLYTYINSMPTRFATEFLRARCPSCRPPISVQALRTVNCRI